VDSLDEYRSIMDMKKVRNPLVIKTPMVNIMPEKPLVGWLAFPFKVETHHLNSFMEASGFYTNDYGVKVWNCKDSRGKKKSNVVGNGITYQSSLPSTTDPSFGILLKVVQHVSCQKYLLVSKLMPVYWIGEYFPVCQAASPVWIEYSQFVARASIIPQCFGISNYWSINPWVYVDHEYLKCIATIRRKDPVPGTMVEPKYDAKAFFNIGLKVDGNFTTHGWFCGKVCAFSSKQVSVTWAKEGDPIGRFLPDPSRLRMCRHHPQVDFGTL